MDKLTKLSEVKRPTPVLRRRLKGETYKLGDVSFELRALPGILETYVLADARRDNAAAVVNYLRFGIVKIEGLCDEQGLAVDVQFEKVEIMGEEFAALSWDILRGLETDVLNDLVARIVALSERGVNDDRAQDFTQRGSASL